MLKYKNVLLIVLSVILFAYAAIIGFIPWMLNNTFDMVKFEEKLAKTTNMNVTLNYIHFKMTPSLKTTITIRGLEARYPDDQPLLDVKYAEIVTTAGALFSNKYDIKSLTVKNAVYDDQILPEGGNKLECLPPTIDPKPFGKKEIVVILGNMKIKNLTVNYTVGYPYSYKSRFFREKTFTRAELVSFLNAQNFIRVKIK